MRARDRKRQQLGNFWLWQRPDSGTWCICWLEQKPDGSHVTRRKATSVRGGDQSNPPAGAQDALAAHHLEHGNQPRQPRDQALVENLMADWMKYHVANLAAPDRYAVSVVHWMDFIDEERRAGRLQGALTVSDLTPALQARFRKWREGQGAGGHTVSRDLSAMRGALNWAWKNQRIEHPPFIADVPAHQKSPPRDRVLSFAELASILERCADRPDREHLVRFIVIELGIAGRPEAVLELTDRNIDLENGLINPEADRPRHLRKRRPIVPIARHVRPWVLGVRGKLIRYRVPIAVENQQPGGPTHFERETKSIKTVWNSVCREAGIEGATPKTLRHTMLTWLARRRVPKEERMILAGHHAQDTTARNYEHLSPDYLSGAIREVDAFFEELLKHTQVHLRYASDTQSFELKAA